MEGRICHNPFAKFYEAGHDPCCPYIEETCPETGEIIRRRPKSVAIRIEDLTDEEIGDYLTDDEKKAMRAMKRVSVDECGREQREKEQKAQEAMNTLVERNKVLETWARDSEAKQKKMEERMEKMASLLSQLISKQ